MSKIGKKNILIPQGVTVEISGSTVTIKGPKGELTRTFPSDFSFRLEGNELSVMPPEKMKKDTPASWGTTRAHLANMVRGVTEGFSKVLEFEGIGYRAETNPKELALHVGFAHPVRLPIPEGLSVTVSKNTITVSGVDKEMVGEFAARIRRAKPPEPYKGTGIRYQGEVIKRKAGKRLAGAAGAGPAAG